MQSVERVIARSTKLKRDLAPNDTSRKIPGQIVVSVHALQSSEKPYRGRISQHALLPGGGICSNRSEGRAASAQTVVHAKMFAMTRHSKP